MIRKFITPTKNNYNLTLEFPEDYLGQELEIIVFKKEEGLVTPKVTIPKKLSEKYRGVFTKKDTESFNAHSQKIRKEWDNT